MNRVNNKRSQRPKQSRGNRGSDGSISYEIRGLTSITTTAAGGGTLLINPAITNQTNSIAGLFTQFRFKSLKLSFPPPSTSGTNPANVLGVLVGAQDTTVVSVSNTASMAYSAISFPGTTVPGKLSVPRRYLIDDNSVKWWKTQQGTSDVWDANQGRIYFNGQASSTFLIFVKATVEFSGPCSAINPSPQFPAIGNPIKIASSHVPNCLCTACQASSGSCTSLQYK
jgi:hypothetical protein